MGNTLSLAISIGVPLVGGIIGGITTQKDVLTWYPNIKKPKWTPPNFLFAPVWTALYVMMGTASWLVWRKKGNNRVALGLYGAQLVLNLIWNPLFFKTHKTDVALVDITALLGLATAATVSMSRVTSPAVQLPLMLPYLVWVSYATALNANIWANNPSERLIKPRKVKVEEAQGPRPTSVVNEAAQAAVTAVEAAKSATGAVAAAQSRHIGKAILAADKVPTAGSAAVHHATAAAEPVVSAAGTVKHTAEGVKHAVQGAGATLGVTAPVTAGPPSATAGTTPATMAPASKAIAKEVEAAAAAAAATSSTAAAPVPAAERAGSSARGATAAIEQELKKAGAI